MDLAHDFPPVWKDLVLEHNVASLRLDEKRLILLVLELEETLDRCVLL